MAAMVTLGGDTVAIVHRPRRALLPSLIRTLSEINPTATASWTLLPRTLLARTLPLILSWVLQLDSSCRNGAISAWEFSFKVTKRRTQSLDATVQSTERVTTHSLLFATAPGVVDIGGDGGSGSEEGSWETVDSEEEEGAEVEGAGFSIVAIGGMCFLLGKQGDDTARLWHCNEAIGLALCSGSGSGLGSESGSGSGSGSESGLG